MTEVNTLQAGTLFSPTLVNELFTKVKGKAGLSIVPNQNPIPQ